MRVFRIVAVLLVITALPSAPMLAQDRTRGTISGVVQDSTGAVVPNAVITLTGPFGTRTMATNDRGEFAFPNLTPGPVTVHAELTGFRPAEARNVNVRLGEQTFVRLVLQPGEVTQAVVVTAEEIPIDTERTSLGVDITDWFAQSVPIGRNLSSLVFVAPGVATGVGTGEQNPSISGATGFENLTIIDGVNVTNPEFGAAGTFSRVHGALGTGINFDFIREVVVQTGGFEAQYGQALGGVVNVVTKSGSNEVHGGLYQYYAPNQLEATQKQPNANLINPATEIHGVANYDVAGEIGGNFVKDKLFFYGAFNPVWTDNDVRAPEGYDMRIRGMVTERQRSLNQTVKLTWNPWSNHQIEGSYFADPSRIIQGPHVNMARNILVDFQEADSLLRFGNRNVVGRYSGIFSKYFVATVSGSRMYNKFNETGFQNVYSIENIVPTQFGTGGTVNLGGIGFFENTRMNNDQFNATATATYNFLGKNQTEFGYNWEDFEINAFNARSGDNWTIFPTVFTRPQDIGKTVFGATLREQLNTTTGQIFFQQLRGAFSPSPPNTKTDARYNAAFLQQTWSPNRYLTLKGGVRWEQQELRGDPSTTGNDPSDHHTFTGNWAPRVGISIDPGGKGRSRIYGTYGLFFEKIPLDLAIRALSIESSYLGLRFSQPVLTEANYIGNGFLSGGGITQIAPGTKAQYQREFTAGVEKSVTSYNVNLGVRYVRRDIQRIVEDMSGITVEQAISANPPEQIYVVGNPGARTDVFQNPIFVPATDGFVGGGLGADGIPDGFADPIRRYWAWEFTAQKGWEEVWQMMASYRYSRLSGNFEGLFRNDNQQQDPNISSLFDFVSSPAIADQLKVGLLPSDQKHIANFYLSHAFPEYGWNFGIGARLASGTPISFLAAHPAYLNTGEIPVGGRGIAGRTAVISTIDLHADYTWNVSDRFKIKPVADVFNILNQQHVMNVVQDIQLAPGVPDLDFGKPIGMPTARSIQAYQKPIYGRIGLRLEF